MKIAFVNAPVILYRDSSPDDDFLMERVYFHPMVYHFPLTRPVAKLIGLRKKFRYGVRAGSRWPFTMNQPTGYAPYPFFMGYAASYLKRRGFDVTILDAVASEEYSYDRFIKRVRREKADITVIECSTPTIYIDLWITRQLARFTEVALAGPHVGPHAEQLQRENPHIRYFLKGEYIINSLEMAKTRRPGIYESSIVEDLDEFPFPFRDYPAATRYFDPSMPTPKPQLQIYGSKGCPFKCTFCMWPQIMYKGKVSLRKPEKIAAEIRESVGNQGYRSILFDDDTFNIGTERISRLCDELQKIGLPWTMMGRLDCSPKWLYDKMVDSGCVGMRFGIETFDVNVLANVHKGLENKNFLDVLTYITEKYPRLMLHLTMMKDMPGQTDEIHQRDLSILKDLGYSNDNILRTFQVASCAPFPGTRMYEEIAREKGEEMLKDFTLYDGTFDTVMKKVRN